MRKLILLLPIPFLLGGCAGLGTFTGAAVREASRPDVVYVDRPYYRPHWHRGWW